MAVLEDEGGGEEQGGGDSPEQEAAVREASSHVHEWATNAVAALSDEGKGSSRRILLFGTSGNPPTGKGGHSGIVEYCAQTGSFDEIWVLPVYQHMYAGKRELMGGGEQAIKMPNFEQRVQMCRLSFEALSSPTCKVKVLTIEEDLFLEKLAREGGDPKDIRVCSFDVVTALKAATPPSFAFSFAVGTDAYKDLLRGKWKKAEELRKMVDFVVISRHGFLVSDTSSLPENMEMHHISQMTDISSTKLREAPRHAAQVSKGGALAELEALERVWMDSSSLDDRVLRYMQAHELYGYKVPPLRLRLWWSIQKSGRVRSGLVFGAVVAVGVGLAVGLTALAAGSDRRRGKR